MKELLNKEILPNGDLSEFSENGFKNWVWTTDGDYVMSKQEGKDGHNAIEVDYVGKTSKYSILNLTNTDQARCELAEIIKQNGSGIYELSCFMKAADEATVGKKLYIKTNYTYRNKDGKQVKRIDVNSKPVSLNANWQKGGTNIAIIIEPEMGDDPTQELYYFAVEFVVVGNVKMNVLISDMSLKYQRSIKDKNEVLKAIPSEKTQIGAIRWDVWDGTRSAHEQNRLIAEDEKYNKENKTGRISITAAEMMMRTLTYYPERAPYFVNYDGPQDNGDVTLSIKSCYNKTGLTYKYDDVLDDLKVKEHPYKYGVAWEEEAKMALDKGIDYFAYLYKAVDDVRPGQVLEPAWAHTAVNGMLPDGRQIKMVAIMQLNVAIEDIDKYETDEEKIKHIAFARKMIYQAMAQSCYLTAKTDKGEFPIMHFYMEAVADLQPGELDLYKKEAVFYTHYLEKRNPEKYHGVDDIYFVAYYMFRRGRVLADANMANFLGFDATSKYSIGPYETNIYIEKEEAKKLIDEEFDGAFTKAQTEDKEILDVVCSNGIEWQHLYRIDQCFHTEPTVWKDAFGLNYEEYIEHGVEVNEHFWEISDIVQYIPTTAFGYNILPRVKTKVSWCNDYGCIYVQSGTAEQIARNLYNGLKFTSEYAKKLNIGTNTMTFYAWDEFDEGGYMQPTASFDEKGLPILNEDGTLVPNTEIIDACAEAIKKFRKEEMEK